MNKFKELDVVKILAKDSPYFNKIGTIIIVFNNPKEAYEVEFIDEEGRTEDTLVFLPNELRLLLDEKIANIAYNNRGLPIFDDIAVDTAPINKNVGYREQMRDATKDLKKRINEHPELKKKFTAKQLKQIEAESEKIKDLTWHHNGEANNMQLVPTKVHKAVSHIGQGSMKGGK